MKLVFLIVVFSVTYGNCIGQSTNKKPDSYSFINQITENDSCSSGWGELKFLKKFSYPKSRSRNANKYLENQIIAYVLDDYDSIGIDTNHLSINFLKKQTKNVSHFKWNKKKIKTLPVVNSLDSNSCYISYSKPIFSRDYKTIIIITFGGIKGLVTGGSLHFYYLNSISQKWDIKYSCTMMIRDEWLRFL